MPARTRSRSTRVVGACAAALTAAALLGACGSDDSTATSTPSASTSTAASSTSAPATSGAENSTVESTEADAPVTSPGEAATAPPAEPEAAPPGFPGPAEVPAGSRDAAFLDALRAEGVEPSGDGSSAINTANYICGAIAQGGTDAEIKTIVTALVGSDAVAAGTEITEEQAGQTADVYISTARSTYCS